MSGGRRCLWVVVAVLAAAAARPYPVGNQDVQGEDSSWYGVTLLAVGFVITTLVIVLACASCCRQRNDGFKEFTNSTGSLTNIAFTNNLASELSIFPPPGVVSGDGGGRSLPAVQVTPPSTTGSALLTKPANFPSSIPDVSDWFGDPNANFPRQQLFYQREIGKGWFGKVVEGEARGNKVVVKILREDATPEEKGYFLNEVKPFRDLRHRNVASLFGRCLDHEPYLMLFEMHPNGDLKSFLVTNTGSQGAINEQGIGLRMMTDIAEGLNYMLDNNFVHTDLAARNCLVSADLTVKIGDYGTGIELYKDEYYIVENVAIPIRWCAPETVHCTPTTIETKQVGIPANVWSFGVVLWEIATFGRLPYEELTDDQVIIRVFGGEKLRLSQPDCPYGNYLHNIMQLCWRVSDRACLSEVLSMLHYLRSYPTVQQSDFDAKWNKTKPNTIPIIDNHTPVHSPRHTALAQRPLLQAKSEFDSGVDLEIRTTTDETPDSCRTGTPMTISPQLSVTSEEFFQTTAHKKSPSLTNLQGSLDDISSHGFDSWLHKEDDEEDRKFDQHVSEAIKDLDETLALEKTSSSSQDSSIECAKRGPVMVDFHLGKTDDTSSDTEDETWRNRIERGEFTEKVREKSKSVTDLMVLTHIDSEGSETDSLPSLTRQYSIKKNGATYTSVGFGSEGNIRNAVLGEELQEKLRQLSLWKTNEPGDDEQRTFLGKAASETIKSKLSFRRRVPAGDYCRQKVVNNVDSSNINTSSLVEGELKTGCVLESVTFVNLSSHRNSVPDIVVTEPIIVSEGYTEPVSNVDTQILFERKPKHFVFVCHDDESNESAMSSPNDSIHSNSDITEVTYVPSRKSPRGEYNDGLCKDSSVIVIGSCEEYTLDYFRGLKTTFVPSESYSDEDFEHIKKEHISEECSDLESPSSTNGLLMFDELADDPVITGVSPTSVEKCQDPEGINLKIEFDSQSSENAESPSIEFTESSASTEVFLSEVKTNSVPFPKKKDEPCQSISSSDSQELRTENGSPAQSELIGNLNFEESICDVKMSFPRVLKIEDRSVSFPEQHESLNTNIEDQISDHGCKPKFIKHDQSVDSAVSLSDSDLTLRRDKNIEHIVELTSEAIVSSLITKKSSNSNFDLTEFLDIESTLLESQLNLNEEHHHESQTQPINYFSDKHPKQQVLNDRNLLEEKSSDKCVSFSSNFKMNEILSDVYSKQCGYDAYFSIDSGHSSDRCSDHDHQMNDLKNRLEDVANSSEDFQLKRSEEEYGGKLHTPDDERSSDSGFRDKGSLSESVEDTCDDKYNLEDIDAELDDFAPKNLPEREYYEHSNESDIEKTHCLEGWFLHPPQGSEKENGWMSETMDDDIKRRPSIDDEYVTAIRNELKEKLPCAQQSQKMDEDSSPEQEKVDAIVQFTYPSQLSPILEEQESNQSSLILDDESPVFQLQEPQPLPDTFKEDILKALDLENTSSKESLIVEDLEGGSETAYGCEISGVEEEDVIIVDTETNKVTLVESPKPQSHLAFVAPRKINENFKDDSDNDSVGINSETYNLSSDNVPLTPDISFGSNTFSSPDNGVLSGFYLSPCSIRSDLFDSGPPSLPFDLGQSIDEVEEISLGKPNSEEAEIERDLVNIGILKKEDRTGEPSSDTSPSDNQLTPEEDTNSDKLTPKIISDVIPPNHYSAEENIESRDLSEVTFANDSRKEPFFLTSNPSTEGNNIKIIPHCSIGGIKKKQDFFEPICEKNLEPNCVLGSFSETTAVNYRSTDENSSIIENENILNKNCLNNFQLNSELEPLSFTTQSPTVDGSILVAKMNYKENEIITEEKFDKNSQSNVSVEPVFTILKAPEEGGSIAVIVEDLDSVKKNVDGREVEEIFEITCTKNSRLTTEGGAMPFFLHEKVTDDSEYIKNANESIDIFWSLGALPGVLEPEIKKSEREITPIIIIEETPDESLNGNEEAIVINFGEKLENDNKLPSANDLSAFDNFEYFINDSGSVNKDQKNEVNLIDVIFEPLGREVSNCLAQPGLHLSEDDEVRECEELLGGVPAGCRDSGYLSISNAEECLSVFNTDTDTSGIDHLQSDNKFCLDRRKAENSVGRIPEEDFLNSSKFPVVLITQFEQEETNEECGDNGYSILDGPRTKKDVFDEEINEIKKYKDVEQSRHIFTGVQALIDNSIEGGASPHHSQSGDGGFLEEKTVISNTGRTISSTLALVSPPDLSLSTDSSKSHSLLSSFSSTPTGDEKKIPSQQQQSSSSVEDPPSSVVDKCATTTAPLPSPEDADKGWRPTMGQLLELTDQLDGEEMTTSFIEPDENGLYTPDWESDTSDEHSSSSGEFIWKPQESLAMERIDEEEERADEGGSESEEAEDEEEDDNFSEGSATEFVPSTWDSTATPSKSALKSPHNSICSEKKKVMFKKEKYQCVYEYPREPSDDEEEEPDTWQTPITSYNYSVLADWEFGESEFPCSTAEGDSDSEEIRNPKRGKDYDFYRINYSIGSHFLLDEGEFYLGGSGNEGSEFFPGQCSADDSSLEFNPLATSDMPVWLPPREEPSTTGGNNSGSGVTATLSGLGELRHTKDQLRLELPSIRPDKGEACILDSGIDTSSA